MRFSLIQGIHFGLEALLAAMAAILYRRLAHHHRRLTALETGLGLMRKRHHAAKAGFHIRLLRVEKESRSAASAAAGAGIQPVRTSKPAAVVPLAHPPEESSRLNRGERDLMMKIRQLGGPPAPTR